MISKGCKSIFPVKHQEIWDRYKMHIQAFWTPEEVDLGKDKTDWEKLNDNERHFIKNVLDFNFSERREKTLPKVIVPPRPGHRQCRLYKMRWLVRLRVPYLPMLPSPAAQINHQND